MADASERVSEISGQMHAAALSARDAARALGCSTLELRDGAVRTMSAALEEAREQLLAANAEDVAAAETMVGENRMPLATFERLRLDESKLREMREQMEVVLQLPDPLQRSLHALQLDSGGGLHGGGLELEKISVPLGVLLVIFEARPDAVTQIAALAIKSGNAVLLKPGAEVERTARALVSTLQTALERAGLPRESVQMVAGREAAAALLKEDALINMVIPRGSKALVQYVQANTRIPVLGHAEGVCHIYVDRDADPELAMRVIEDAKLDYPAACNAVETVLVHEAIAPLFVPELVSRMHTLRVETCGDERVSSTLEAAGRAPVPTVCDWHTEYGTRAISVGVVRSVDEAISHIHTHGSSHTESIITRSRETADRFLREVDAASVMHNASTRFADGFRYGFGAEVGISTSKFHARGPVGLEGLTTYKYVVRGEGHIAGAYRGAGARQFTHRVVSADKPA